MNCDCPFFGDPHPQANFCRKHPHASCGDDGIHGVTVDNVAMRLCSACLQFLFGKQKAQKFFSGKAFICAECGLAYETQLALDTWCTRRHHPGVTTQPVEPVVPDAPAVPTLPSDVTVRDGIVFDEEGEPLYRLDGGEL
jgi:hypothetical protein